MIRKSLVIIWYLGIGIGVALVSGTFLLIGYGHRSAETFPAKAAHFTPATYHLAAASEKLFPHGYWWAVKELAALLPYIATVAFVAIIFMLIGYLGVRNHHHNQSHS